MNLTSKLKKIPHFSTLATLAARRKVNIWLVGGFLRDSYLKLSKPLRDFDFCVEKNTTALAREFARKLKAKCIVLDKHTESLRVIVKREGIVYTYDFTRMRGKDLSADLALRDFSVNSLAVDIRHKPFKLIDCYQGLRDLKSKTARIIKKRVIADDPLRILRGFSLLSNYGFKIEPISLKVMVKNKRLIKRVSKERISEELFKILASNSCHRAVKLLDKFKIIDEIIPEISQMRGVYQGAYHHLKVWQHCLETLRQFELLNQKVFLKDKAVSQYLSEPIAQGHSRLQIVKLACLLHDIGKPAAKRRTNKKTIFHTHEKIGRDMVAKIGRDLRFSAREIEMLKKLTFWHLRPGYLADQLTPTQRAVYRFFRDTQEEGVGVVVLSLADWRATRGPLTNGCKRKKHEKVMLSLVDKYFTASKKKPLVKLVDGYDIMKKFKIEPGRLVGEILTKIKEEQALGKIASKAAAYCLAKEIIPKKSKKK